VDIDVFDIGADERLSVACVHGDVAGVRALLRFGTGRTEADTVSRWAWNRLDRASSDAPSIMRWTAAVSSLSRPGSRLAVEVDARGAIPEVWLGVEAEPGSETGLRRLLAPTLVLSSNSGSVRPDATWTHAWRPRPIPGTRSTQDVRPGLIERLLAVPRTGWVARILAESVPVHAIEASVRGIEAAMAALEQHRSRSHTVSESETRTHEDPGVTGALGWLEQLLGEANGGRGGGAWSVRVLLSGDESDAAFVGSALVGEPSPRPGEDLMSRTWDPVAADSGRCGVLPSDELAYLLRTPDVSLGALKTGPALPGSRVQPESDRPLRLGRWWGTTDEASIDVRDLGGHAFIAGVTGSGKSTSLFAMLRGLWEHGIPFLLIDPVKTDHDALLEAMPGQITVLTAADIQLSALRPWPGTSADTHVARVSAAIRSSFAMPPPVPYVVAQLLDVVAAGGEPITLHDLAASAPAFIAELGYGPEVESNIRAALLTRLAMLTAPDRAPRYCAPDNGLLAQLLTRPTIIRLADLGDDEERSFLVALLTILVAESAAARGPVPDVHHVLVIEEAHRLVPEPVQSSAEVGDPASTAARLITGLLAEIRAYGESVLVVDQSPGAVARQVVRSTSLKLVHRLVERDDREMAAAALGMNESDALVALPVGIGILSSARLPLPQVVEIGRVRPGPAGLTQLPSSLSPGWPCCGRNDAAHHRAETVARHAEETASLWLLGTDPGRLDERWRSAARRCDGDIACVQRIGLARATRAARRLGVSPASLPDVDELLRLLASGAPASKAFALMDGGRPLEGCARCPAPCRVRLLGAPGPSRPSAGLAALLRSRPMDSAAIVEAVRSEALAVRAYLPDVEAAAVGFCAVAHVVDRRGTSPDDLIRAMGRPESGEA